MGRRSTIKIKSVCLDLVDFFRGDWMTNIEKDEFIPLFKTLEIDIKSKNDNNINQLMSKQTSRFRDLCMLYMIAVGDDEQFGYFMNIYTAYNDIHYEQDLFFRCAVTKCEYNKATMLIDKGIDVCTNDNFAIKQITDQDLSDRFGDDESDIFLQKLIDCGADVNANNGEPLTNAAKYNIFEYVVILIKNGADPIINNNAPICNLCSSRAIYGNDDTRTLEYLISVGADANARNGEPLNSCIYYNEHFVKILLANGANINYLDHNSLYKIIQNGNYSTAKLLQSHGVDFGIVNALTLNKKIDNKKLTDLESLIELLAATSIDFKLLTLNLMKSLNKDY